MKRLACCALIALLTGCIPIGFQARTSSLPSPDRVPVTASTTADSRAAL